jgi:hypothetical protein
VPGIADSSQPRAGDLALPETEQNAAGRARMTGSNPLGARFAIEDPPVRAVFGIEDARKN